ncbi:MAG: hypothetical protein KF891_10415 [Rhizobacter sp.]|nr:hypothetical protein [Rhizobacter sp.]
MRHRSFATFEPADADASVARRALMRGQNFWVEWVRVPAAGSHFAFESEHESMLISVATPLTVQHDGGERVEVPGHSVTIVPAGRHTVSAHAGGEYVVLASHRADVSGQERVINEAAYATPDPRIVPAGRPWRRHAPLHRAQVLPIDEVRASADKPRLKMLQTEALSVNVVEYRGVRDRTALSPHSHADFEQGSLALAGDFVHHLRVPWGANANLWRDDEHLPAPSPSLLVVPVDMVHTTEGVGDGHHLLIDVFSPPRHDFIDKGWVFNAHDYEAAA